MSELNQLTEIKEAKGKIVKVSPQGWGFISSKDIPFKRIFFHWSVVRQFDFTDLKYGMRVTFNAQYHSDKPPDEQWRADKVTVDKDEAEK